MVASDTVTVTFTLPVLEKGDYTLEIVAEDIADERGVGNEAFSSVFTYLLNQKIKDTLCGTKVVFKKQWERIDVNRKYFGEFDPFGDFELLFGAAKLNLDIVELPVKYKARKYGDIKISRFRHGLLLLRMAIIGFIKLKLNSVQKIVFAISFATISIRSF